MVFAVADKEGAVGVDEDAVRARELASLVLWGVSSMTYLLSCQSQRRSRGQAIQQLA